MSTTTTIALIGMSCLLINFSGDKAYAAAPTAPIIAEDIPIPVRQVTSLPTKPIGWADVPSNNDTNIFYQTTTGGAGGTVVTASSGSELQQIFTNIRTQQKSSKVPFIVKIKGAMSGVNPMIVMKDIHNITVIGEGTDAKFQGTGLDLNMSSNIIIQNLTFEDCPDDGICLHYITTHHVWVDHCQFSDLPMGSPPNRAVTTSDASNDGGVDVKREASYVTVSYCHFENHNKTMLIGHDDKYPADAGHLKVTVHNNWYGYVYARATRNRFGMIHLFNNYYRNTGSMLKTEAVDEIYEHGYAISSNCGANVVVENNYFHNVLWPTHVSRPLTDPIWITFYGNSRNGKVHWGPTSAEPPGTITFRGTNIQNPPPGTLLVFPEETYQIMKFDTTNPDPANWNPWTSYGYDAAKVASILLKTEDVPNAVMRNVGPLTGAVPVVSSTPVKPDGASAINYSIHKSVDGLTFSFGKLIHPEGFAIYDLQGKLLWRYTPSNTLVNHLTIQNTALKKGSYVAKLTNAGFSDNRVFQY